MTYPTTLQNAILFFSDFDRCRDFMVSLRWPDGVVTCPRCGSDHVKWLDKARVWKCYAKHKRPTFSLKTDTIFEDSPIGLDKWLAAVWLIVNCKNGISSYELGKGIGVTQKSAWFMNHRIRLALQEGSFSMLGGEVEVDETFIGGKARNMHTSVGANSRSPEQAVRTRRLCWGCLSAAGRVRTTVHREPQEEVDSAATSAPRSRRERPSTPTNCYRIKGWNPIMPTRSSTMPWST